MERKMYSIEEIAIYLDVSVPFIRKLIRSKEIPYYRIGNRLKFDKNEIDEWLEIHKERDERRRLSIFDV